MKEKDKDKDKEKKAKEKNKSFIDSHKQVILYFAFGIITTVCSLGACYATLKFGVMLPVFRTAEGEPNALLDIAGSTTQWITGVIVAFFTNKKWVFGAGNTGKRETVSELSKFAFGRLGTLGLDTVLTFGTVWLLNALNYTPFKFILTFTADLWSKIVASVVVVITNYVISKFIVFKRK